MHTLEHKPNKFGFLALFFLIVLIVGILAVLRKANLDNLLQVSFLDVGQGDAILIQTPRGSQVLLDGGPDKAAVSELQKLMPAFDRTIDLAIVSNPDKDHIAGFLEIFKRYSVDAEIEPGTKKDTDVYQTLRSMVLEEKIPTIYARKGMRFYIDEDVVLEIFFPDRDVSTFSANDGSLVAKLQYKDVCFMLQGDATAIVERTILSNGSNINCEVLKAGHHGSDTSSSKSYVEKVSPQIAVISAGKDNRYGHPHKKVLEIFSALNIPVLRTDEMGTITLLSDGNKIFLKKKSLIEKKFGF